MRSTSKLRAVLLRPIVLASFACTASISIYACSGAAPGTHDATTSKDPAFKAGDGKATACVDLHSLEECGEYFAKRHQLVEQLDVVEGERDVRNVPLGLDAIATRDVLFTQAGLRIVGPFPEEKGVADAAQTALLSPYVRSVGPLAAELALREPSLSRVGAQWKRGHTIVDADSEWRAGAADAEAAGFVLPAGAEPYPIADSMFSVGLTVPGTPEATIASLHAEPMTIEDLAKAFVAGAPPKWEDFKARAEAALQKQDEAAIAAVEAEFKKAIADAAPLAIDDLPFPLDDVRTAARGLILEGKPREVARWAVVYEEPVYKKTVLMLGWTVRKAPSRPM